MDIEEYAEASWLEITKVGLRIVGEPTWEEYQNEWHKWELFHRLSTFALGDLLAYGERRWGETYAQVAALTQLSVDYLRNVKYVCANVPLEVRVIGLSFSHHQAVASIREPAIQKEWLGYAAANDLTRDELRQLSGEMPRPPAKPLPGQVPDPIVFTPEYSLADVVVRYIQAYDAGDSESQEKELDRMRQQVKDML